MALHLPSSRLRAAKLATRFSLPVPPRQLPAAVWRMGTAAVAAALAVTALLADRAHAAPAPPAVPTRLAWLQDGRQWVAVQRGAAPAQPALATLTTPLGSVWKLFVHAYLSGRAAEEPAYRCSAPQRPPEDDYCCDPGDSVTRDDALARSCGPYFEPARLALSAADWRRFWSDNDAPAWLLQLGAMQPSTEVAVADLLAALRQVPAASRNAARRALLPATLRDRTVLAAFGSGPRFKTWSWQIGGERAGGAAGWLADGTPFWFGSAGTSLSALPAQAGWIAAQWAAHGLAAPRAEGGTVDAAPCVDVAFFARYPIRSVQRGDGSAVATGPLRGRYRVRFDNGSSIAFDAAPGLALTAEGSQPAVVGRLTLEDYVARVVDREGSARETEAARALAVAARTYLLQNAAEADTCRAIADDSRTQRVSPNPPSEAARAAAAFTEGLVIDGAAVRYHLDRAAPGVMSWQAAVEASRSGQGFEAILREAFPGGALAAAQAGADCAPLPQARDWLLQRQQRWRELLRGQSGYEPPGEALRICQLALGTPHSDQRRMVIRVREWHSREDRVTLIHEYLHLAFRHHPSGRDEAFIERLAQRLADS